MAFRIPFVNKRLSFKLIKFVSEMTSVKPGIYNSHLDTLHYLGVAQSIVVDEIF